MARFFVPLDVNYQFDEKIVCAGHVAECLYVRGLAYAKRAATEGRLHRGHLAALTLGLPGKPDKHADALVNQGLWEPTADGWYISGWLKHNLSNTALVEQKAKIKAKSIAGNHKQHHTQKGITDPDCELCNPPNREPEPSPQGAPQGPNRRRTEDEEEPKTNRTENEPLSSPNGFSKRATDIAERAGELHGIDQVNNHDGYDRFALATSMTRKLMRYPELEDYAARDDLDIDLLAKRLLDGRPLPPRPLPEPDPPAREHWEPEPIENTGDYRDLLGKVLNHPDRFLKPPIEETA